MLLCAVALSSAASAEQLAGKDTVSSPPVPAQVAVRQTLADEVRALKILDTSGDPKAALAKIDEVLARAKTDKSITRYDILFGEASRAAALFWLRDLDQSLAIYQRVDADLTARRQPMTADWGGLINNIGSVLSQVGKLDEAMPYKQRSLDIAEKMSGKESAEYSSALFGIGLIDFRRGRPLEAIPKVKEAARISRIVADKTHDNLDKPAIYELSLSALQLQSGDSASSVETARGAALWAEAKLGEGHRVTMAALNQLGASLSDSGLYAQAIPVLRRTLDLRMKAHPADHPDVAYSLHALGFAIDNAGLPENALQFYEKAADIFEKNPDRGQPMTLATVIGQEARIAKWRGDGAAALRLREKAFQFAKAKAPSPQHPEVLRAEINLASELIANRRYPEAQALLDHANSGLADRALPANVLRLSGLLARARVDAAQLKQGAAMDEAVAAMVPARARLFDRATPRHELARVANQYHPLFVQLARLAGNNGRADTAFEALQLANISDLQGAFSTLAGLKASSGSEATEAIRAYQTLAIDATRLRNSLNQAVAAGNQTRMADQQTQLTATETRLREQDKLLAKLIPAYAALTSVDPVSLGDAQKRLAKGGGMVVYGQDEQGLLVLAITSDNAAIGYSDISSRELLGLQKQMRGSIEEGLLTTGTSAFDRQSAYQLYLALFPLPVRKLLTGIKEINVLATGHLASLPFAALVTAPPKGKDDSPSALRSTQWLAARQAVNIPIRIAASNASLQSPSATHNFAGIGAPTLGPEARLASRGAAKLRGGDTSAGALLELTSLPNARRELIQMAAYFDGNKQLLVGAEATEAAVKSMPLEKVNVLAFATHGLVGGRFRDLVEPALVLTPPTTAMGDDDGLLTASEVARLRLNADWVILSACDTSAGDGIAGPTYSGLARSFVAAGARSLLLSHWPVRDDVASRLTLSAVDGARKGLSRAEALRQAELAVLRDGKLPGAAHPATWAPFVVLGD